MKNDDRTGQKYEMLTVIKKADYQKNGNNVWECLCECGETTFIMTTHLTKTKSCGCLRRKIKKENLLGQRFEALLVIAEAENINNFAMWLCQCDCGNQKVIKAASLKSGKSVTCGCKITRFINNDPKMSSAKNIFDNKYSDGDLTFDQFLKLSQQICFYCGIEPSNSTNRLDTERVNNRRKRENQFVGEIGTFVYNGLDRVDSNGKHDLNNVVPCCYPCNWAKLDMSVEEFKAWITRLYEFWIKK